MDHFDDGGVLGTTLFGGGTVTNTEGQMDRETIGFGSGGVRYGARITGEFPLPYSVPLTLSGLWSSLSLRAGAVCAGRLSVQFVAAQGPRWRKDFWITWR